MKIGIIGLGFVGLSFASVLASKGYSIIGVDADKEKLEKIKNGIVPFYEPKLQSMLRRSLNVGLKISSNILAIKKCNLIFVTVGTPQKRNGEIDLTMIKNVTNKIGKLLSKTQHKPIIIIKSTVIPGTTQNVILPILQRISGKNVGKDFGLLTNPEFLRETMAVNDTLHPHVIVLGGDNDIFLKRARRFYSNLHHSVPIVLTNYSTAEIIKYANNSFLATKISFINLIASICEEIPDANIDDVAKTIGLDPRIGNLFLDAGPGYGGSCLPKDVKAIINFSTKAGINPTLLTAVEKTNKQQINSIIKLIKQNIGKIHGRKIAVLGIAFKPETDDIRDSVSVELVNRLIKLGAKITIHDPKAIENTKKIFKNKIKYQKVVSTAVKDCKCAIIMTAWKQYEKINNKTIEHMAKKFIIDSRRIISDKKLNAKYFAIGLGQKL
jgi:UDPglucose 6-dehydrogenase